MDKTQRKIKSAFSASRRTLARFQEGDQTYEIEVVAWAICDCVYHGGTIGTEIIGMTVAGKNPNLFLVTDPYRDTQFLGYVAQG